MSKNTKTLLLALPYLPSGRQDLNEQMRLVSDIRGVKAANPFIFVVPNLKVGSLDTLLDCSDVLAKYDSLGEQIVSKHLALLEEISGRPRSEVAMVEPSGQTRPLQCLEYLQQFRWDDAQYPASRPVKFLLAALHKQLTVADEGTKSKLQDYSEIKTKATSLEKRLTGNLTAKPLGDIVTAWARQEHGQATPIDTEHLTTLFVAIPKQDLALWEREYPNLDGSAPGEGFVVPRSSKLVAKEDDLLLMSVILFKSKVDDFKHRARGKKWVVREFDPSSELTVEEIAKLRADMALAKQRLESWLRSAFSEVYIAWAHLKALRLYVEALLRYGLPPAFVPLVVNVNPAAEKELRKDLGAQYKYLESKYGADDVADTQTLELKYPYVSLVVPTVEAPQK